MIAVLIYMVHVVLQYATDVNNLIIKNSRLRCFGEKVRTRALCAENSVECTQSYTRVPVWPEIRVLTSIACCTQGLHAVLVRVGIMCDFCSYVYPHNVNTIVSI